MSRFTSRFCVTCNKDTMHYVAKCSHCGTTAELMDGDSHYKRGTKKIIARIVAEQKGSKTDNRIIGNIIGAKFAAVRRIAQKQKRSNHYDTEAQKEADKLIAKIRGKKVNGLKKGLY